MGLIEIPDCPYCLITGRGTNLVRLIEPHDDHLLSNQVFYMGSTRKIQSPQVRGKIQTGEVIRPDRKGDGLVDFSSNFRNEFQYFDELVIDVIV